MVSLSLSLSYPPTSQRSCCRGETVAFDVADGSSLASRLRPIMKEMERVEELANSLAFGRA